MSEENTKTKEELLIEREVALNEKEAALNQKEADLKILEEELKKKGKSLPQKPEPGLAFSFRGENYKFNDKAPKNIRFGGLSYTQEEIVKDEEVLVQIIGANSYLIEKVK